MSNADLSESYRILEIEPGASMEEVTRAFRELSKTWNPNRFGNDRPRRQKAEEKIRKITQAYERIKLEGTFGLESDDATDGKSAAASKPTAPTKSAAIPAPAAVVTEPSNWKNPWWYSWMVAVVLAMSFLVYDSIYRQRGIDLVSGDIIANAPKPKVDLNSLTGYEGNQHVQIMPALGTDGYHWIMQTELMLAGKEGIRVRHTDYDGVPGGADANWNSNKPASYPAGQPEGGREVHWSSFLHWLVAGIGWVDHVITGAPMTTTIQRAMPWANTLCLALMILIMPALTARRFGWASAALLALGFVVVYPYYEFSFLGYFDHHGIAASSALMMILFIAFAGAGWLRDDTAKTDRLTPAEMNLWKWLPNRRKAKFWMIMSAIAGGAGLWISTATIIFSMVGIGIAALISTGVLPRFEDKKNLSIADPTLWRVWGAAGALSSLFFYALEYLPSHFTWRLEVNHPLYALAWFGAGDLLCRLCWLIQGRKGGPNPMTWGRIAAWIQRKPYAAQPMGWGEIYSWLVVDLAMVLCLAAVVIFGGEGVWVLRSGKFLMNLHFDYILEFRSFLRQMNFLEPMQVAGGINVIPMVSLPIGVMVFVPSVPRAWKGLLMVAFWPAAIMLMWALVLIRWLGTDCAVCVAGLSVVVFVVVNVWPDRSWGYVFLAILAMIGLGEFQNYASSWTGLNLFEIGWFGFEVVALVVALIVSAAIFGRNRAWGQVLLVFGAVILWQIFLVYYVTPEFKAESIADTLQSQQIQMGNPMATSTYAPGMFMNFINEHVLLKSTVAKNSEGFSSHPIYAVYLGLEVLLRLVLFTFFPALVAGALGAVALGWKSAEMWRSVFLGGLAYFIMLVVVPFPIFTSLQWAAYGHVPPPSDLDLTQAVTRDVSHRLRSRLGNEQGVIISGPTTTTWMMYFGGFRGVGTLYWENIAGLRLTASIYSSPTADAAHKLILDNHVTHIAIFSWDPFAEEYARLDRGIRAPANDQERGAEKANLKNAFVLQMLSPDGPGMPNWLRPLPYRVPEHPKLHNSLALIFEVVPPQTPEESALRQAQWMMSLGTEDWYNNADSRLRQSNDLHKASAHEPYLPALVNLGLLEQARGKKDDFRQTMQVAAQCLSQAPGLAFDDHVDLAIAYYQYATQEQKDDIMTECVKQLQACAAMADEKGLRHLTFEHLVNYLQLLVHINGKEPVPPTFKIGLDLLPPGLEAQVLSEQGETAVRMDDQAKSVEFFHQALKLDPNNGFALLHLARILAASPMSTIRNGKEALALINQFDSQNHEQNIEDLDVLACANAEAGNFDDAIFYESQALQLAQYIKPQPNAPPDQDPKGPLQHRLDLFKAHQAFHQQ